MRKVLALKKYNLLEFSFMKFKPHIFHKINCSIFRETNVSRKVIYSHTMHFIDSYVVKNKCCLSSEQFWPLFTLLMEDRCSKASRVRRNGSTRRFYPRSWRRFGDLVQLPSAQSSAILWLYCDQIN